MAFRRTWLVGFSAEVYLWLLAAERGSGSEARRASGVGGTVGGVVRANRRSLVERAFDEEYGHLRMSRPRRLSGTGYESGAEAGAARMSATPGSAGPGVPSAAGSKRALSTVAGVSIAPRRGAASSLDECLRCAPFLAPP